MKQPLSAIPCVNMLYMLFKATLPESGPLLPQWLPECLNVPRHESHAGLFYSRESLPPCSVSVTVVVEWERGAL